MRNLKYIIFIFTFSLVSCEEGGILIEEDISDKHVTLIAPMNNGEISSNTVYFDWGKVEGASTYEMQVASPDFENTQQLLLNTIDSTTFNELELNIGDYEWRVRANNSGYHTEYSTASFKVVPVENFSDNTVLLINPENNLITNIDNQNLEWQSIEEATLYRIQLINNGEIYDEQTTDQTSIDVVFEEGNGSWKVRAENGTENTLYSSRSILVDLTPPNRPILLQPENKTSVSTQPISFEWDREINEGSVEFDSIYIYRDINLTDLVTKEESTSPFSFSFENNDTYYWTVKSFDEAGNNNQSTDVFSFMVEQ